MTVVRNASTVVSRVATIGALGAATGAFNAGDRVYVASVDHQWTLDPTSTLTPDGITVVAAAGGGNWLRLLVHSPKATARTTWGIDTVSGNDENSGVDGVGTRLKTLAELARRLRVIDCVAYTANVYGDIAATDTFDFCPQFSGNNSSNNNASMTIVMQQSAAIATGTTVNNGTDTVGCTPASNQQSQANGGFAWASYVGKLGFITSGSLAGYTFGIAKDLGSNIARISHVWNPTGAPGGNGTFAAGTGNGVGNALQNGDTFEVRDLGNVNGFIRHAGISPRMQVYWKNATFTSTSTLIVEGADIRFVNCRFLGSLTAASGKGQTFNSAMRMYGCVVAPTPGRIAQFDCRVRFVGCTILNTSMSVFNTGRCEFINTLVQGGQAGEGLAVGRGYSGFTGDTSQDGGQMANFSATFGIGIFDVAGPALKVVREGQFSNDAPLYGSGNTIGLAVDEGGHVFNRTGVAITLTGTTELQVDGAGTAMPDITASAGGSLPATSALTTQAQLNAAPFNGNVVTYKRGSSILTVASPD